MNDTTINPDALLDKVSENIKAREHALEVFELCGIQPQRFYECLKSLCESRLPLPVPPVERFPAMEEPQAKAFESLTMPYGAHKGTFVRNVPVDYLLYISEGDEFSQKLKSYVKSKRFQDRQDD